VRLLDHVVQCTSPFIVRQECGTLWPLTGPKDFAQDLEHCPLRYVLADDLVRACVELAYSEGDGLSGCLDLIHLPAERLWIEWNAAPLREELARALPECARSEPIDLDCSRNGVLIDAKADGRMGRLRTFWLTRSEPPEPQLAAVETLINLDGEGAQAPTAALLDGAEVAISDRRNANLDALLQCARFRFLPAWQRYYSAVSHTADERERVIRYSLGTVAFLIPTVFALFLLMMVRPGLPQVPSQLARLNAKRARLGKVRLLEHIEVHCPVFEPHVTQSSDTEFTTARTGPRFHHVRGHIVRRQDAIFWRRPHWRGHLRAGAVRSRTVTLHLSARTVRDQSNLKRERSSAGS
jgi:hypothetical protein